MAEQTSYGQQDIFIKIDTIKGESRNDKHKDEIDVESFSWGMTQGGTMHKSGGGGAGRVQVEDLTFVHRVDAASPLLWLACMGGTHIKEATLTACKAGGDPLGYLKIKMSEVLVKSAKPAGSGEQDKTLESVSLNFAKVDIEFTPQGEDGKPGGPIKGGFDIAANKKA
jgi:type VI secretion system secreted protein Hcp